MDLNNLMQMANQLREQLSRAQAESAKQQFEGEAGGGLVKVTVNGRHEVVDLKIDPKAVDPQDLRLLEDLVRAAINQAMAKVTTGMQDQLGSVAQGMGLDLSSILPGFGDKK